MTNHRPPTLLHGLALAAAAVGPRAAGVPAGDDPLRLDLPTLGPGSGDLPNAATVRVFASLYFAAELEQAGVVPIAELLVQERDTLNLTSYAAAAKLDDFATREHQWYDRSGRVQVYARLFGIGAGATNEAGALVNREFVSLFASLCQALDRYAELSAGAASIAGLDSGVRTSAQALLANLALRGLGNTLLAARRLEEQTRYAVEILRDPAVCGLVGARTMQDTIIAILGKDAPDVQRLIDSGLNGQKVLEWLATALPRIADESPRVPVMTLDDPIAVNAGLWLRAVGLHDARSRRSRPDDVGARSRARRAAAGPARPVRRPARARRNSTAPGDGRARARRRPCAAPGNARVPRPRAEPAHGARAQARPRGLIPRGVRARRLVPVGAARAAPDDPRAPSSGGEGAGDSGPGLQPRRRRTGRRRDTGDAARNRVPGLRRRPDQGDVQRDPGRVAEADGLVHGAARERQQERRRVHARQRVRRERAFMARRSLSAPPARRQGRQAAPAGPAAGRRRPGLHRRPRPGRECRRLATRPRSRTRSSRRRDASSRRRGSRCSRRSC